MGYICNKARNLNVKETTPKELTLPSSSHNVEGEKDFGDLDLLIT